MMSLIVLLAVTACAVAEPLSVFSPYSYLFNYPYSNYLEYPYARLLNYPYYNGLRGFLPYNGYTPYAPYATPYAPYSPYYAGVKSQYHFQDGIGQASYGHVEPGQRHHAVQDAFGNKVGSFSYYNAEGKLIQTSYIADGAGYRVTSNDLPIAPENKLVVPVDTPEVLAAKEAHLKEVEAVKARSKRDAPIIAPVNPIVAPFDYRFVAPVVPQAYPTTNLIPKVTKDGFLEETPEVIAAKALHFAEHAAATARNFVVPPFVRPSYYPYLF